ncbi:CFF_collapsed_G0021130.mRNA.1.CDS.1 [Saccharomyces cerevisiae]|nr:CFF_collapsed_G0021130.mRNA.1.CDS.1 [Saccharomyces cerevisiae]
MSYKQYFDNTPLQSSILQCLHLLKPLMPIPFLPNKHPVTQRFHDPKYSLRRMSDVYKLALRYGVRRVFTTDRKH